MKPRPPHKRGSRSGPPIDPVLALRDYAIKLHDKGDGHGVDWARVAETLCRVTFGVMREGSASDPGMRSVARRAHDAAYSLMTGEADSAMPYAAGEPVVVPAPSGMRPHHEPSR